MNQLGGYNLNYETHVAFVNGNNVEVAAMNTPNLLLLPYSNLAAQVGMTL